MRVCTGATVALAALVLVLAGSSLLLSAERKGEHESPVAKTAGGDDDASPGAADHGGTSKKGAPRSARDPVASAFVLPKGVVLNSKQQQAYQKLKSENESDLRKAIDQVADADTAEAKTQAVKEVKERRTKIRAGIQEILSMPYRDDQEKSGDEYAKRRAEEMRHGGYTAEYGYRPDYYRYNPGYYYNPYWAKAGYHGEGKSQVGTNAGGGGNSTKPPEGGLKPQGGTNPPGGVKPKPPSPPPPRPAPPPQRKH